MSVTEHLMRPGTFSVGLRSTFPSGVARGVLAAIDGAGAHIVITPGRLPPGISDASVLSAALYTGKIEERPSRGSIEGKGISAWLGNDDGTSVIETAISNTAASITTWITALLVNGITVGTITNTTTYTGTFVNVTYREAIDQVCLATGAEYEVKPNFTINAAAAATLFGAPTVVVTKRREGVDGQYRGIEGGLLDQAVTATRQARKIVVVGQAGATGSATNAGLLLKDKAGNAPTLTRLVDAASEPSGNLTGLATATLALSGVRREFNVSSTSPGVRNFVRPGSYVYVYDVDSGIYDPANQIMFRGQAISPLKVRVLSLSWPIERGMGVYLRTNAATPVYTDLSDYVEFDQQDAFWTVGSERVYEASGSTARLGANATIADRTGAGHSNVILTDAAQTITTSTVTDITWGTEVTDPDGWTSGGIATLTVPAGFGGRYLVTYTGQWSASAGTANGVIAVVNGSSLGGSEYAALFNVMTLTLVNSFVAGDTLKFQVFQNSGANRNVTSRLEIAGVS